VPVPAASPEVQAASASPANDIYLFAGLGVAALLLAALLLRRRRDDHPVGDSRRPSASAGMAQPTLRAPERTTTAAAIRNTPLPDEVIDTTTDHRAAASRANMQAPGDATVVEEHKSAVELADIMISFGRVQGAAETWPSSSAATRAKAVTPWLKLLEVYRSAGLRTEFDTIAGELNKTFNVTAVNWDNYQTLRAARTSLEDLPAHRRDAAEELAHHRLPALPAATAARQPRRHARRLPVHGDRRDPDPVGDPRGRPRPLAAFDRQPEDAALDRIVDIDELGFEAEFVRKVGRDGLRAVTLGRVVPGSDIGHARFARQVHRLLRDLARHIQIGSRQDGLLEVTLRTAGAPRHPADRAIAVADQQRHTPERLRQRACDGLRTLARLARAADPAQVLIGEAPFPCQPMRLPNWALLPSSGCTSSGR
jgi:hypothetical protein